MKIAAQNDGQRGFTLVEILIAMSIFMVIIMAIYASWSAILRSSQAGVRAAADVQRTRMTVKCIEDSLASTVYFTENAALYSFETDTSTDFAYLSFVSRLPSSFPGSGLFTGQPIRRVAFEVIKGESGGNELVMLQSSTLQVLDETESPYTITLATNISQFTLEFWDDQAEDWAYEWLETNSIPRMVRVALAFGGQANSYQSAPTTETKTIYLAGTAITKEIQSPAPTAGRGAGGRPGQGGGGPGGGGPGGGGAGNPTIRIGPDGRPIITPGGGDGRNSGNPNRDNNNNGRNNNNNNRGNGNFQNPGGNFNPGGGPNNQGGPRIPGQSSPKGGRR